MQTKQVSPLDDAYISGLTPLEKVKTFMVVRDGSIAKWAKRHGWFPQHVYNTLDGDRAGEAVWNAIAEEIGVPRSVLEEAVKEELLAVASEKTGT